MEEARKKTLKDALLGHACLPQLREVATMLDQRFGSWESPKSVSKGSVAYSEVKTSSWRSHAPTFLEAFVSVEHLAVLKGLERLTG